MADPRPSNLPALKKKFRNFDSLDVFEDAQKAAFDTKAQNFVILFGKNHAKVALNLDREDFKDLLLWEDEECPIRWINFWNTTRQASAIDYIGIHYGFSRRLRASITAWDKFREIIKSQHAANKKAKSSSETDRQVATDCGKQKDLESGLNGNSAIMVQVTQALPVVPEQQEPSREEIVNFKLIQESLNYTTTDYGSHFLCFGANWLHVRPTEKDVPEVRIVPPKHWSWYALCSNNTGPDTVISFHEAPNYETPPKGVQDPERWKQMEMKNIRSNTVAVMEQLSSIGISKYKENILLLKSIREHLGGSANSGGRSATSVTAERLKEVGASNLFYYLFEDYSAAVSVLNGSKSILGDLSARVLRSANKHPKINTSDIIPRLHELGKDLRQLQHLFSGYKTLFLNILTPPDHDAAETRVVRVDVQARERFKRLIDRLQLLMLNTITEHLDEKSELSNTYFNLTAQKDSEATARLTRSATLLAKLSVFFLPISFITSYFSVQIPGLLDGYTVNTYWGTFGVVATISFASLFFFSKLLMFISDKLDAVADGFGGWVGRRTLWRTRARRRGGGEHED